MRLSSRGRNLAASGAMIFATIAFSSAVVYDHLIAGEDDLPAETAMETAGRPVTVTVGDTSMEAESFRLDPLLHRPHELRDVSIRMPEYSLKAVSATMVPGGKGVDFRDASLRAEGLTGDIGLLRMRGNRVVFDDVRARGGLFPLRVDQFQAGGISLPERSLEKRGISLGKVVDTVSGRKRSEVKRRPAVGFGFERLEVAVTLLFQRGYIREGFLDLPDGKTKVRFHRGTYTARHDKIYVHDAEFERQRLLLTAKKAEILMKRGTLVLFPPVERRAGETVETVRSKFEIDIR